MRSKLAIAALAAAGALSSIPAANGAMIYATQVESFTQGARKNNTPVPADRSNPNNALGAPQNNDTVNFVSLGFGGSIVLSFGQAFTQSVLVVETTYNNPANHYEQAAVYVGVGATAASAQYYLVGTVQNTADGQQMSLAGAALAAGTSTFNYVKIVDTTPLSSPSEDAFDVDGVGVMPVPAPGAAALALMGGLCVARRRRS